MNAKHTSGPLTVSGNQLRTDRNFAVVTAKFVGNEQTEANLQRLAHCWNNHDALLEALQRTEAALTCFIEDKGESDIEALDQARAAIQAATGG